MQYSHHPEFFLCFEGTGGVFSPFVLELNDSFTKMYEYKLRIQVTLISCH